jgi:hypothetical protein
LDGRAGNNDSGGGWRTPRLDVGSVHIEIAAVLVPTTLYISLHSIDLTDVADSPGAAWVMDILPPGQQVRSLHVDPKLKTQADPSGCA